MSPESSKVCIVTGVSRGIGFSTAQLLLANGFIVYGLSRNSNANTANLISSHNTFHHQCIDITDFDAVKPFLRQLWSVHKTLNLIVNCAGIPHGGLLSMTNPEEFHQVFSANFYAPIFLAKSASRYMSKSNSPQIIFISSSSAFRYDVGTLAYASSKSALNYATKQLSFEFSSLGIRVNCIAPGVTNTPMLSEMSSSAIDKQLHSSAIPAICEPLQIAELVLYLYYATHVNGQIIRIDGGLP